MTRLRLDIAYDGTDFTGWATQPGLRTVQGTLEDALALVLREPVRLTVAGRTDAGVHAEGQVAHVDVATAPDNLLYRLARLLPGDVRVLGVHSVSDDFDARFSALRRHYVYRLTTAPYGAEPFERRHVVAVRPDPARRFARPGLDIDAMREASYRLLGLHDFAAFCRRREGATTVRELQRFDWTVAVPEGRSAGSTPGPEGRSGDRLDALVSADAFCWSMVRSLVGAILAVGQGRRTPDWAAGLLTERTRSSAVTVAPAHGLSLVRVDYPDAAGLAARNLATREVRRAPGCCGD